MQKAVILSGGFSSTRKSKVASRGDLPLCLAAKLAPILILLWITASPFAANAQQKENHKPTKVPAFSIDINHATARDFAKLPGVGPELARRITSYRSKHGAFHRVEDLLAIRGIGPRKWRALKPYLRIEEKN